MTKKTEKSKRKRKPKPTQLNQFVGSKRKRKPRPDRKQLKAIYKLLLSAIPEARVNQLIAAVHWYDAALDYIKDDERKNLKLQTTKKTKVLDSIEDLRTMSMNANSLSKREDILRRLIEKFEQALAGIIRTKTLTSVYAKLKKIQTRLEKRSLRLESKSKIVIGFLEEALQPRNARGDSVQFKVGDLSEKPRSASIDFRTIMYSKEYAQQMLATLKKDGFFPIVLSEIDLLARICAHKPNEEEKGKWIVDLKKDRDSIFQMLQNLINYCQRNPKLSRRLIKTKRRSRRK
jgi:hypothetical protein